MEKIKPPAIPKLNKGELLIVNSKQFEDLIDSINNVIEQCDTLIKSLESKIKFLENKLSEQTVKHDNLIESYNGNVSVVREALTNLNNNVAYLATAIEEGGFLND